MLVATDVAARGIDVELVTHVINFQCPEDEKTYLHRTGRTGRAGATGVAVTFVDWDDLHRWTLINKALDLGIPEPQETYSSSAHLFSDQQIPTGTKGTLPRSSRTRAGLGAERVEDIEGSAGRRKPPSGRGRAQKGGPKGNATSSGGGGAQPAADRGHRAKRTSTVERGSTAGGGQGQRRRRRRSSGNQGAEATPSSD